MYTYTMFVSKLHSFLQLSLFPWFQLCLQCSQLHLNEYSHVYVYICMCMGICRRSGRCISILHMRICICSCRCICICVVGLVFTTEFEFITAFISTYIHICIHIYIYIYIYICMYTYINTQLFYFYIQVGSYVTINTACFSSATPALAHSGPSKVDSGKSPGDAGGAIGAYFDYVDENRVLARSDAQRMWLCF